MHRPGCDVPSFVAFPLCRVNGSFSPPPTSTWRTFKFLGYLQAPTVFLSASSARTLRPLLIPITSSPIGLGHAFLLRATISLFPSHILFPKRPLALHLLLHSSQLSCPGISCFPLKNPWTDIRVLRRFAAGDCPSCSNCFFLHLPLHLLCPPHLVLSNPGSNPSRISSPIFPRSSSSMDLSVIGCDDPACFFLVYASLRRLIAL